MEQLDELYRLKEILEKDLLRQDCMSDRTMIRNEMRELSKEITRILGIRVDPHKKKIPKSKEKT